MPRQAGNGWRPRVRALGLFALLAASPATAIDVSGVYVSEVTFLMAVPCTLTFAQSGTTLTVTGPCDFVGTIYTFDVTGSVDSTTGAFSLSGRLLGLCESPGAFTMAGSGDGEVFSGTVSCSGASSPVTGTKCGNGVIDAAEECEDGNAAAGDCCSPVCRFDPIDAACTADAVACTRDVCDGAGQCLHPLASSGAPCESDSNACTDDACDAGGQCLHVAERRPVRRLQRPARLPTPARPAPAPAGRSIRCVSGRSISPATGSSHPYQQRRFSFLPQCATSSRTAPSCGPHSAPPWVSAR